MTDPISMSIIETLARPGGNVTGLTIQTDELVGKRFELLREIVPDLHDIAVMGYAPHQAFQPAICSGAKFNLSLLATHLVGKREQLIAAPPVAAFAKNSSGFAYERMQPPPRGLSDVHAMVEFRTKRWWMDDGLWRVEAGCRRRIFTGWIKFCPLS
jgi:hypothetical protein